jgi:hypothetical protein
MSRATMFRWGFLILLLGGLSSTLGDRAKAAADSPETETQALKRRLADALNENAKLRDQNSTLERHLIDLGAQIKQLEALKAPKPYVVIPQLKWAPPADTLPQSVMPRPIPEGWREQQFNGVPYYLIPLQSNGTNQAAVVKP